jgi:hypothetical protein
VSHFATPEFSPFPRTEAAVRVSVATIALLQIELDIAVLRVYLAVNHGGNKT